jgi:hypothetical protein
MMHNPNSKPELIAEAKTMEDLEVAITGSKGTSKSDINIARDKIDMGTASTEDISKLADEF